MNKLIIAVDLGGTKTLLRAAETATHGQSRSIKDARFASGDYASFNDILREFMGDLPGSVSSLCIAVAGPVSQTESGYQAHVTNLPWRMDSQQLAAEFSIQQVKLINDFQAIGYAIDMLPESDFDTLQQGAQSAKSARAVLGAGTGLGQASLIWSGDHYEVQASEGGHVDFAPCDALQIELLQYLLQQYPHVSYERVVSGQGLVTIFNFLVQRDASQSAQAEREEIMQAPDPAAAISQSALEGKSTLARQSVELFANIYAAQAGNFALSILALNGVYLAGGILPKILPLIDRENFVQTFNAKGRMSQLTQKMPLRIILNTEIGLIGATAVAARMANTEL